MIKEIDKFVELLYQRQNIGAQADQKNLLTKSDYYKILESAIDLIKNNPDADIAELREKIYEQSGLEAIIREYFLQKRSVPGAVFSYGTKNYQETIVIGNSEEVRLENGIMTPHVTEMSEDTIFDLASVTKIFTSLCMMKLLEKNLINLSDEVVKYDPRFKNLKGVTLYDLLSFNVPLKTKAHLSTFKTREEAEEALFEVEVDRDNDNLHPYTDIGVMILKFVIEKVTGMSYYDFLDKTLLSKYGMTDTHILVPERKIHRVASNNFDSKVLATGETITNTSNVPGVVYDSKAQVMGQLKGNLSGHAGLFSTVHDMTELLKHINAGEVLGERLRNEMAMNRRGKRYQIDGTDKYVQYFGYMTYSKHPILEYSEVFHALSGRSFAGAGWTGTQMTVDPLNELYFFLGSNRAHNRITGVDKSQNSRIITIDGQKGLIMPDGSFKIDARDFAYKRDDVIVHPVMKLLLQYEMLEYIFKYYETAKKTRNVK